ncbi:potassium channel family protein [Chlorobium phaeobacteroides]|jgi:hypothetical protein|uniref:Ion transport 2 domain protein n=1 Tax=Chlorobium phaeobacteroides (strain DSM 266 / SMG 266 / 2430) TaxID=290317 RepID=A1BG74_CHLPD|nr:potassium channel family protein [Chlorobium phaeobacteroides]ABL65401.1 Ion transport 2 domain protein [Chlorobium phaeobacteroides DSM 266]MBV5328763.1 two pore domain potassium channel family protein [Chlorobium sp.]
MNITKRIRATGILLNTNRRVLLTVGFCLFLSVGFVEILEWLWLSGQLFSDNMWFDIVIVLLLISIPLSLFYAIFHVIHMTLTGASRNLQLGSVLLSYLSVIIVFSGFYYFQSSINDLSDSIEEYRYYEKLRTPAMTNNVTAYGASLHRQASRRAFHGVSKRMWKGVGDKVKNWPDDAGQPPVDKLVEASRLPIRDIVLFDHTAKFSIFLDCLYFSAVTITSTGFGDIVPLSRFNKIIVSLESISGVVLIAIGIAIALGGLGKSSGTDT